MNIFKHLLFSIIISTVIALINVWNFNKGQINTINVISTLIFLLVWFLYGLKMKNQENQTFFSFVIVFWIGGIVLGGIYSIMGWKFLADILMWIYRIPSYGLEYLLYILPLQGMLKVLCDYVILFILPLSISIIGYLSKRKSNKYVT